MRRTILYGSTLLLIAGLAACDANSLGGDDREVAGSGTIALDTRDVADFEKITLAGEGMVVVTEGRDPSLTIETDDNLLAHIETTVAEGTLKIATERGIDLEPSESVLYRVTAAGLTGLTLAGAGSFRLAECTAESFSLALAGAGDIEIGTLTADSLHVQITGAGRVVVAGKVGEQEVSLEGVGRYEGRELESARASVSTAGVGSATVWVTEQLDATIAGVGDIDYYGTPRLTQSVAGLGSINARG